MRKVFKSICLFLIFHFVLCSREDEQMSAHVAAGEQTRHRAVVVQKQWQTPPTGWGSTSRRPTNTPFPVFLHGCVWWRRSEDLSQCPVDVLYVTRPSTRRANGFSSVVLNVAWQQKEAAWMGKPHLHRFIHFDVNRWCHQQTGENVKDACACACVCTCGVSMRSIIHCFKHVLRTYFTSFEGELCSICFYFEGFICTSVL